VFERLSYSILVNSGLGDLCVTTVDDYVARAVELAANRPRIAHLRANLREQLKASPLGQTEQFARDFYDLVARTVEAAKVKA
jgi:predicted O-linked N-acetylglucosamine transferase (SPINDLY family)